jgi:hypothetical protein
MTFSIIAECCHAKCRYAECHYAECHVYSPYAGAVMMGVVMLIVVNLRVMAPYNFLLISFRQCYKTFLVTCASRQSFSLINLTSLV